MCWSKYDIVYDYDEDDEDEEDEAPPMLERKPVPIFDIDSILPPHVVPVPEVRVPVGV